MLRSTAFWQLCNVALVVVAALLWLLGVTGWGAFAAALTLATSAIVTTTIDSRRRRDDSG